MLDPEIAHRADIIPGAGDLRVKLMIRSGCWEGRLVRSTLVMLAEDGEELVVEGTFFVPELEPGDEWQ